jgi:hypothetical protein
MSRLKPLSMSLSPMVNSDPRFRNALVLSHRNEEGYVQSERLFEDKGGLNKNVAIDRFLEEADLSTVRGKFVKTFMLKHEDSKKLVEVKTSFGPDFERRVVSFTKQEQKPAANENDGEILSRKTRYTGDDKIQQFLSDVRKATGYEDLKEYADAWGLLPASRDLVINFASYDELSGTAEKHCQFLEEVYKVLETERTRHESQWSNARIDQKLALSVRVAFERYSFVEHEKALRDNADNWRLNMQAQDDVKLMTDIIALSEHIAQREPALDFTFIAGYQGMKYELGSRGIEFSIPDKFRPDSLYPLPEGALQEEEKLEVEQENTTRTGGIV